MHPEEDAAFPTVNSGNFTATGETIGGGEKPQHPRMTVSAYIKPSRDPEEVLNASASYRRASSQAIQSSSPAPVRAEV